MLVALIVIESGLAALIVAAILSSSNCVIPSVSENLQFLVTL